MPGARWTGGTFTLEAGVVTNESIASGAGIDADKMQHTYKPGTNFGLVIGGTPTTREEIVFVASQAGTIRGFNALLNDTGTSSNITFDLKKNGSTVLSGVVTITNATADRSVQAGTLSATTFAADDVFSISMAVSSSTGAQGPFAWIELEENQAP
jgi:hypothetical protein